MKIQLTNSLLNTIEDRNGIIVKKILSNLYFSLESDGISCYSDSTVGRRFHILTHRIRFFEKGYSSLRTYYTGYEWIHK